MVDDGPLGGVMDVGTLSAPALADMDDDVDTEPDDDGRHWITPDTQPGQVLYFRLREVGSTGPWAITWSTP